MKPIRFELDGVFVEASHGESVLDACLRRKIVLEHDLSYQSILTASRALFPDHKAEDKKPVYKVNEAFESEIKEKTDWDGPFLKKVREYKSWTIEKLSEVTKVNPYYITALETMNPDGLPATVFVRGYVVQVAKTLCLNEKAVADSYMKNFKAGTRPN